MVEGHTKEVFKHLTHIYLNQWEFRHLNMSCYASKYISLALALEAEELDLQTLAQQV